MSRIITLTSDFGLADHYVGSMKGVILGINSDVVIVDISHEIPKYDIVRAALLIGNFYAYFPKDTIHVVVVDPGVGSERKPIAIESEQGIFVGPDNGVFSLILEQECSVYDISNPDFMLKDISSTFHGRDIFAPAAAHLSRGADINQIGGELSSPKLISINKPQVLESEIIGEVIYKDSFGNLITNIPGEMINEESQIIIDDHIIDTVASSYNDVSRGEVLAIIGSSGFLEIAVNQGSASEHIKSDKVTVKKQL